MTITFYWLKYESKHSIQDDLIRFWIDNWDMELIEEENLWEWRTEYGSEWKVIPPPLDLKEEKMEVVEVPPYTKKYTEKSFWLFWEIDLREVQIEILTQALQQLQQQVFNQ